jgi:hypothetical protein
MIARMARANGRTWLLAGGALATSAVVLGVSAAGCAESTPSKPASAADPNAPALVHPETLDHEACNESGNRVDALDTNNDGKADVKKVYDRASGKEICCITDVDHDGKPDMYEYYDGAGNLRRREAGYDQSGIVDAIETYENGRLTARIYDTTGQHRVDTWDYFDSSGNLTRRERDSTNDGRVDQWWTFGKGDKITIAIDRSGDGKPDPADTVVIGGTDDDEAQAKSAAASSPAAAAPDAGPPKPALYVPAGMDAGSIMPTPAPVVTTPAPAAATPDAGAPASKGGKATGKKKGSK